MSQTEDYSPEDSLSDNAEELLRRSRVFSTDLCLVRTKNIHQVRDRFLQAFEKTDQNVHREAVWPWHLGRESYH